jgi:hypothetical protein
MGVSVRTVRARLRLCCALASIFPTSGCCGIGAGLSVEQVQREVAPLSSGRQAYDYLKRNGFAPRYNGPQEITGEKMTNTCFWYSNNVLVDIKLDDRGVIVSRDVGPHTIAP